MSEHNQELGNAIKQKPPKIVWFTSAFFIFAILANIGGLINEFRLVDATLQLILLLFIIGLFRRDKVAYVGSIIAVSIFIILFVYMTVNALSSQVPFVFVPTLIIALLLAFILYGLTKRDVREYYKNPNGIG